MVKVASNQVEARNKARDAYNDARKSGVKGRNLDILRAAFDAAQATVESVTGTKGNGGVLS